MRKGASVNASGFQRTLETSYSIGRSGQEMWCNIRMMLTQQQTPCPSDTFSVF